MLCGVSILGVGLYRYINPVQLWVDVGKPHHPVWFGYLPLATLLLLVAVLCIIDGRKYGKYGRGGKMRCLNRKVLLAYVLHAIQGEDEALVESHLQECDSYFKQMQELQMANLREAELNFEIPPFK